MRAVRRCKDDRALLEGPHLVLEAARAAIPLEVVVATEAFLEGADARVLLAELPRPPLPIAPAILGELLDSDSPRGVAAIARLPARDRTAVGPLESGVALYADGVQDPGNLGALVRSAEGAGALALFAGPGCAHPNHPRALRGSAGSLLRLPVARVAGPDEVDATWSERPDWWGLSREAADSLYELEPPERLVLAVGSEAHGLSRATETKLDAAVGIPLEGALDSLNAAVAASVALFEIRRRRG